MLGFAGIVLNPILFYGRDFVDIRERKRGCVCVCQIGFCRGEVFVFAKEQLWRGYVCGGFADCTR